MAFKNFFCLYTCTCTCFVCAFMLTDVSATADRDVIPVRVVKKNIHYSVARSHPHSILLDLS